MANSASTANNFKTCSTNLAKEDRDKALVNNKVRGKDKETHQDKVASVKVVDSAWVETAPDKAQEVAP